MTKTAPWGYHLIVDARDCDPESIRNPDTIDSFARTLVQAIDMVPYGDPQIIHFGSGDKAGFTLVQLIETSNICAHFVEETNDLYLDVFSCKTYDEDIVLKLVHEFFKPKGAHIRPIERSAR